MQAVVGWMLSIVVYGLMFGAVYKLFAISNDLAEIKTLLKNKAGAPAADPTLSAHAEYAKKLEAATREWSLTDPGK